MLPSTPAISAMYHPDPSPPSKQWTCKFPASRVRVAPGAIVIPSIRSPPPPAYCYWSRLASLTGQEIPTGAPPAEPATDCTLLSVSNVLTVFSPRPNAARVAALSAREMDLAERAQRLEPKLTRRKHVEIECELAVVRRLLDQLGFRRSA